MGTIGPPLETIPHLPSTRDLVILDPQWVIDAATSAEAMCAMPYTMFVGAKCGMMAGKGMAGYCESCQALGYTTPPPKECSGEDDAGLKKAVTLVMGPEKGAEASCEKTAMYKMCKYIPGAATYCPCSCA